MAKPRILSVGQCGFDGPQIARVLGSALEAQVVSVDTHDEARQAVTGGGYDLVLVNRIGDADGASGLDLIRSLKADPSTRSVPAMLVSNLDAAQDQAVALGAVRGFGKANLQGSSTVELVRSALAPESA